MLKKTRAQRFADTLRKWDDYKVKLARMLKDGVISIEEHDALLRKKAEELDL